MRLPSGEMTNIPPEPHCLFWFGEMAVNLGVDLSFIGAVGCFAYTNANLGAFLAPGAPVASDPKLGMPVVPG